MARQDYALLIGIGSYPRLGEGGTPANLRSPRHDVEAVKAWLVDPAGGDVPEDHVTVIMSPDAAESPTGDQLEAELLKFGPIAEFNKSQQRGFTVGRRIYLYMSGHGFVPLGVQRACLFTANANEWAGYNVHATGWLNWLQEAGFFREYVLGMDCCEQALPGVSTWELDRRAEAFIRSHKAATPSFKGLYGFPASLCTSINTEVVHGIPSKKRVLREGDILSVDCGVCVGGLHADSAVTVPVKR